jgi:hypothetical protein
MVHLKDGETMAFFVVENQRNNLSSMKNIEHLNYSINEHFKRIKEHLDGEKILNLFQFMAEYSVIHSGVSYMNNKTMASKLGVSVRTVQRYTKKLESLKVLLKIPTMRKKNNSQTSNTYVILPVLKKACHGGCHTLNPSLNPLKQEKNINTAVKEINDLNDIQDENDKKLVRYVFNRIQDAKKTSKKEIEKLSSYVDTVVRSEMRKAKWFELMQLSKAKKEREPAEQPTSRPVPFYNWLDEPAEQQVKNKKAELDKLGIY